MIKGKLIVNLDPSGFLILYSCQHPHHFYLAKVVSGVWKFVIFMHVPHHEHQVQSWLGGDGDDIISLCQNYLASTFTLGK